MTSLAKRADYVGAQANQGTPRLEVEVFAAEQKSNGFKHAKISRHHRVGGDRDRIEARTATVIHDVAWFKGVPRKVPGKDSR
jgi:hypothetical protein